VKTAFAQNAREPVAADLDAMPQAAARHGRVTDDESLLTTELMIAVN